MSLTIGGAHLGELSLDFTLPGHGIELKVGPFFVVVYVLILTSSPVERISTLTTIISKSTWNWYWT